VRRRQPQPDGSLTTIVAEHQAPFAARWAVVEGTGAYSGFKGRGGAIRDDVADNPVSYSTTVAAPEARSSLTRTDHVFGHGSSELPHPAAERSSPGVRVDVTASDPFGNRASLARAVRLPR
jgi:hypothetical protein